MPAKQHYYLHFETKPSFKELDVLFEYCEAFRPVLATSYVFVPDLGKIRIPVSDLVHTCFPRYRYVLIRFPRQGFYQEEESGYTMPDL